MNRTFQLALIAGLAFGMSSQVNAQIFTGAGADSNWSTAANWDNGVVPTATDNVVVGDENNSGVAANYDGLTATINDLRIANGAGSLGSTGTLDMNSGTLTTNGWAFVGSDANSANTNPTVGTYNLGGTASLISIQRLYAGIGGAAGATATGTINVSGNASIQTDIGIYGSNDDNTGIVNQSGGTVNSNSWTTVGEGLGAQGQYNLSGGSFTTLDLTVGQADAGTRGEFNLSGSSSATVTGGLLLGRGEVGGGGATGDLTLAGSSGTFTANGDVQFGSFAFAAADAVGDLNFIADAGGVTTLDIAGSLFLNDGTSIGGSNLSVDLTQDANFGTYANSGSVTSEILLVDNINNSVTGTFTGLAEGASISIGGGLNGILSYVGGDGNDITVTVFTTAIPEPSSVLIVTMGLAGLALRRRRS